MTVADELGITPGSEDEIGATDALSRLERGSLVSREGQVLLLTTLGWDHLGGAPGSERDEEFLRGLVDRWRNPEYRRTNRDYVVAADVYSYLGPSESAQPCAPVHPF